MSYQKSALLFSVLILYSCIHTCNASVLNKLFKTRNVLLQSLYLNARKRLTSSFNIQNFPDGIVITIIIIIIITMKNGNLLSFAFLLVKRKWE